MSIKQRLSSCKGSITTIVMINKFIMHMRPQAVNSKLDARHWLFCLGFKRVILYFHIYITLYCKTYKLVLNHTHTNSFSSLCYLNHFVSSVLSCVHFITCSIETHWFWCLIWTLNIFRCIKNWVIIFVSYCMNTSEMFCPQNTLKQSSTELGII